jgi:hypothetical protein
MPLSDRKAGATNYPLNKILKIRFALVVCFISIFSLNNSDNLKGRAKKNEFSETFRKNSLYKFENLQEHGNNRYKKWYVECK